MGLHRERWTRWLAMRRLDVREEAVGRERVVRAGNAGDTAQALVAYLWLGQCRYLDAHGTAAHYPGQPSIYGARNDGIEGVTRLLPLWAAYIGWARADTALAKAMRAAVARALDHGSNPRHPGYWGDITHRSTLICEAADVALCVWLLRSEIDALMPPPAKTRLLDWLAQVVGKDTADNNWHLFVALVDACLERLRPGHRFSSHARLQRIESFRVSDGCFRDGPQGRVDFYNAWAFHYLIFWLRQMEAPLPTAWRGVLGDFCAWYRWLFAKDGLPLFGRSLCYRHAAPVPLLALAMERPESAADAAEAAGRFCQLTRLLAERGGLRDGCFSQGVLGPDVRWLDPYSGPASSLWGSRAALLLLAGDRLLGWSAAAAGPSGPALPGVIEVAGLGARIVIDSDPDHRRVEFHGAGDAQPQPARLRGPKDHLRQLLRAQASRPQNNLLDLGWRSFESDLREYG